MTFLNELISVDIGYVLIDYGTLVVRAFVLVLVLVPLVLARPLVRYRSYMDKNIKVQKN